MQPENRRSFVKKSVATTISLSSATLFSSLIRARGDEGGEATTSDPWETTVNSTTEETTFVFTTSETTSDPWGNETTTGEQTTEIQTTPATKPKKQIFEMTLWAKSQAPPATGNDWIQNINNADKNNNPANGFPGGHPHPIVTNNKPTVGGVEMVAGNVLEEVQTNGELESITIQANGENGVNTDTNGQAEQQVRGANDEAGISYTVTVVYHYAGE